MTLGQKTRFSSSFMSGLPFKVCQPLDRIIIIQSESWMKLHHVSTILDIVWVLAIGAQVQVC